MKGTLKYTKSQLFWLVTLRVIIGWHFLYEGLVKLVNPNWSSVGFLLDSEGAFKGLFHSLAANPTILKVTDLLNIWGLIAIGFSLIIGLLSRWALMAGIVMLGFYYLSHPPFVGLVYDMPMEGSYLVVNRILIELITLIVLLLLPTSRQAGLDRFIFKTHYGRQ